MVSGRSNEGVYKLASIHSESFHFHTFHKCIDSTDIMLSDLHNSLQTLALEFVKMRSACCGKLHVSHATKRCKWVKLFGNAQNIKNRIVWRVSTQKRVTEES